MDNYYSGDQMASFKISPEEAERRQKKFLEELESLREEEREIIGKFGMERRENIFIDHTDEKFSFKENLRRFVSELTGLEGELTQKKVELEEIKVNQALSMLRILREKAQTLFTNTQENQPLQDS